MNAVIYARYSSDSQREESIEGQLRGRGLEGVKLIVGDKCLWLCIRW